MNTNPRRALLIIGVIGIVFGGHRLYRPSDWQQLRCVRQGHDPWHLGWSLCTGDYRCHRQGTTARRLSLQSPVRGLKHISGS